MRVRNRLIMLKQDADFCTYYKEVNPNYYAVWGCEHCGYAAQDIYFESLTNDAIEKIKSFLTTREINIKFQGPRRVGEAIHAYKIAIFLAELIGQKDSVLGGLYIKLAWLYREKEEGQELKLLERARHHYEQTLNKERLPIGNMTQLSLEYLVGELYRRTGKYEEALSYLTKVTSNLHAKDTEPRIYKLAREAWRSTKELQKMGLFKAVN